MEGLFIYKYSFTNGVWFFKKSGKI